MTERRSIDILDEFPAWPPEFFETPIGRKTKHFIPILMAVRDHDCRAALIWQRAPRFKIAEGQTHIGIVGDDTDRSLGPDGFHRKSVARFISTCRSVSIVSSGAEPVPYFAAVSVAIATRKNVVIIETLPQWERDWETFAREAQPNAQIIICRPRRH